MGNVVLFLIRPGIIDLGAFCVELWSFFVSKRISVPMSYISLWEHTMLRDWWKNNQFGTKMSPASRSRHPGSPPGSPPGVQLRSALSQVPTCGIPMVYTKKTLTRSTARRGSADFCWPNKWMKLGYIHTQI